MIWNYHDEDRQAPPETISISINNLTAKTFRLTEYRIDNENSNSYEVWKKMGSPQSPGPEQVRELEIAGMLKSPGGSQKLQTKNSQALLQIKLARQGVSLLTLEW